MRILVVGAGATGGYFGARLAQAGRDVTFLVRPARAAQLRTDGLRVVSSYGDVHVQPVVRTAHDVGPDYDVVILAVKAYALTAALDDLAAALGPHTMLLPFLNGMRHLEILTARFGEAPILGGVCRVATTLDDHGTIVQLNAIHQLAYGERDGTSSTRIDALDHLMQGAGFEAHASVEIMLEMWEKWVLLAALGALTCLMRGTVGEVEATPYGAELARRTLAECAAIATASGYPPRAAFIDATRAMLTAVNSSMTSSMYRDLQAGRTVEADQILGDLLDRARRLGVGAPLVTAAFTNLRVYAARLLHAGPALCAQ